MESKLYVFLKFVNKALSLIGRIALTVMILLTGPDVLVLSLGYPILGAYELVAMLLAVTIGFTIPKGFIRQRACYHGIFSGKAFPDEQSRRHCLQGF